MAESNWALGDNGASVVAVSHEASHVSSTADNLLVDGEDRLWITGDAPQYVVLMLAASHPPLHYAGWHVWHDYLTNPKRVEVASGENLAMLTPLLVCQALPGAGTQVWKLPQPIPTEHRYIRFTIMETFGPGPTYMNNVVLLASDPGPDYCGSAPAPARSSSTGSAATAGTALRGGAAATGRAEDAAPTIAQLQQPPASRTYHPAAVSDRAAAALPAGFPIGESNATPRGSSVDDRPPLGTAGSARQPYQSAQLPQSQGPSSSNVTTPQESFSRRYRSEPAEDSVGVFARSLGRAGATSTPTAPALATPTSASGGFGGGNSGRMSQLLRDLDEDIRSLRPIKTVSPKKDMLLYVPRNHPVLAATGETAENDDDDGDSDDDHGRDRRRRHHRSGSGSSSSSRSGSSDTDSRRGGSRRHRSRHWNKRSGTRCSSRADGDPGKSNRSRAVVEPQSPPPVAPPSRSPPQSQPWPVNSVSPADPNTVYGCAPPPVMLNAIAYPVATTGAPAGVFERISSLEQAVAALTQTVQHQREDITMMKRLLLQQATERRKEVEFAKQQQQQLEQKLEREQEKREREARARDAAGKSRSLVPVSTAAATPQPPAAPAAVHDLRLTHHRVDVDFPEDALRGFVQAVLEEKLKKQLKKSETKITSRLDSYLRDVVASIADGVDERVHWHLQQAAAQQQALQSSQKQQQQQQQRRPAADALNVPAMSVDHTTLSGVSAVAPNTGNTSGYSRNPAMTAVVDKQPQQIRSVPSSGTPSPVIVRGAAADSESVAAPPSTRTAATAVASMPNAAPPVGGPSPHKYDTRSYRATVAEAPLGSSASNGPQHVYDQPYAGNRYAPV